MLKSIVTDPKREGSHGEQRTERLDSRCSVSRTLQNLDDLSEQVITQYRMNERSGGCNSQRGEVRGSGRKELPISGVKYGRTVQPFLDSPFGGKVTNKDSGFPVAQRLQFWEQTSGPQKQRLQSFFIVFNSLCPNFLQSYSTGEPKKGLLVLAVSETLHNAFVQQLIPEFAIHQVLECELPMGGRYVVWVSLNAPSAPTITMIVDSKEMYLGKFS
jgi:hypothetical protein